MAVTTPSDVFKPEVIGDIATDILFKNTPLVNSPFVTNAEGDILGAGGDTVTFPYFDTTTTDIVQNAVTDSRTGVTPSKLHMGSYTETLESKVISFDASKYSFRDVTNRANLMQHMAEVVAQEMRADVQRMLIEKAMGTSIVDTQSYVHGTAASSYLTVDGILKAKADGWGEKDDDAIVGLLVTPQQWRDLATTTDFKTLATAPNQALVAAYPNSGIKAIVHNAAIIVLNALKRKGGTVSSITRSGAVATLTTAAAHNLVVGDKVVISGATETEYNGTITVVSVPTTTTFTYAVSGTPTTPATGTPVIRQSHEALILQPAALSLYMKQEIEGEVKGHAGTTVRTHDYDMRFTGTLKRRNPRPVIRFRTAVSA